FRNDITIRGGGPSENVYYLDGIEIPQINHFATQGSAGGPAGILNVAFIEDVNLSSSSFGSGYDNALSSVIAVTQKEGNKERLQGNVRVSATEVALTFDGPISEKTTFIASARRSYLDLLFTAIDLPIRPNFWDFQFKTTTQFDNRTSLTILGVGAIDLFEFGVPRERTPEKEFVLRAAPAVEQWNYTIGAAYKKSLDKGQLFIALSRNMFDNQLLRNEKDNVGNVIGVGFRLNSQEIENKGRVEYRHFDKDLSVRAGLQAQYSKYNNATLNRLSPTLVLDFASDLDFFRYGAYVDANTTTLNNRLLISGGLRFDGNTFMTTGNEFWRTLSPRIAASYIVDSAWSINATVGHYFKLPQYTILGFRDASGALVNQNTQYLGTTHFVAGVEFVPEPSIRMTLEGFYKAYSDYPVSLIDSVSLANRGTDFGVLGNEPVASVGRGRAYGAELFFQKKLTERFFTTLSYTLLFSEFTGLRSDEYIPSAWDFRHLVSGIVGYKFDNGWELGGKFRYAGGSPFTAIDTAASRRLYLLTGQVQLDNSRLNQERLRAFRQVDFRVDKKWSFESWSLDLFLDVQNAFAFALDAPQQYTFARTEDNSDWVSTDGQPVRPDGSNATPVFLDNTSTLVTPTIGIIIEF
ncbi:MAG TPA: TonB-dependent receptor, partial [Bacteroidetes bacterium]|nr:TonB-dependent receptor [Bacteroidota bacterium]